jgi:hypothetical protein
MGLAVIPDCSSSPFTSGDAAGLCAGRPLAFGLKSPRRLCAPGRDRRQPSNRGVRLGRRAVVQPAASEPATVHHCGCAVHGIAGRQSGATQPHPREPGAPRVFISNTEQEAAPGTIARLLDPATTPQHLGRPPAHLAVTNLTTEGPGRGRGWSLTCRRAAAVLNEGRRGICSQLEAWSPEWG